MKDCRPGRTGDHGGPVQGPARHARQHGGRKFGSGPGQGQAGMSEGISAPFIRYPIGTSLMMAGILFVGLVAYPLLPVAPLPQVDFPTIQVAASLPGASPETMASSVAQPLERQFAQIPGIAQMTSTSYLGTAAVTIQFDLNRSIDAAANDVQAAINAAGGQLPKNLPSPPTYRKVNPADSPILLLSATSDTLPLTTVSDAVDAQLAQQISQISGVAQVIIGGQQKPAIRVQIDPGQARRQGPVAGGRAQRRSRSRRSTARRAISTATPAPTPSTPTTSCSIAKDWNDVIIAYRNGGPLRIKRHRPGGRRPGRRQAGGLGQRQARRVPGGVQAARRQRHRDRRQDQGDAAAAGRGDPAGDQDRRHQRPHPDHPRRGRGRAVHAAADHRAGGDGDLRLPAQLLGHRDPDRHGAAGAARRLRADVGVRLHARQPVADGADHRGRLRRRRRHRDAGKHHPLYRGRREADGRRLQGRPGNRLHHRLDQHLAGRGADPAAADGRHHRPAVPRIRGDAGDDDLRLDGGVADADADDGLALPARAQRDPARPVLPVERARLRRHAARL